mmetsp:Transcript_2744/g.7855  ORF Transcript_2744/g.7855 Transcript_2744/m.7855 type:complete len:294 (+) Transcript_2744:78-959(+)
MKSATRWSIAAALALAPLLPALALKAADDDGTASAEAIIAAAEAADVPAATAPPVQASVAEEAPVAAQPEGAGSAPTKVASAESQRASAGAALAEVPAPTAGEDGVAAPPPFLRASATADVSAASLAAKRHMTGLMATLRTVAKANQQHIGGDDDDDDDTDEDEDEEEDIHKHHEEGWKKASVVVATRKLIEQNAEQQVEVRKLVKDLHSPAAFNDRVVAQTKQVGQEVQSPALAHALGSMWMEMRRYGAPFLLDHLEEKQRRLKAREPLLKQDLQDAQAQLRGHYNMPEVPK